MRKWSTKSGYSITQLLSGRCNVFLVDAGGLLILIDTSTKRNWNKLDCRLRSLHIDKIDYLILTHTHHDHCGSAAKIRGKYKAKVIVHELEAENLRNGLAVLPEGTNKLTKLLIRLGKKIEHSFSFEPCQADIVINKDMDLRKFGINAFILRTPGHSAGSVSVIIDNEIAVVGDTLFGIFPTTVFPPFADDPELLFDSWEKLLSLNCDVFLPSHGKCKSRSQLNDCYFNYKK